MVFRPVWSKIVNTFCLTSLKKGYVSVRFLAEEGEGRNVALKKNINSHWLSFLVNFFYLGPYISGGSGL